MTDEVANRMDKATSIGFGLTLFLGGVSLAVALPGWEAAAFTGMGGGLAVLLLALSPWRDEPVSRLWGQRLRPADFARSDERSEFMVYEAAFLWHGYDPPSIPEHWSLMTPEVKTTKRMLHAAIEAGQLKVETDRRWPVDDRRHLVRRHVTPRAILDFCDCQGRPIPEFVRRHPKRLMMADSK